MNETLTYNFRTPSSPRCRLLFAAASPSAVWLSMQNKYFDKAKAEMLERRKYIELRLVSVDEPPQKRRELRAEMKGIDFCISVLDANR